MFRFIHAADFHLDSPFGALSPQQAAARRQESRELPFRLADYVNAHQIDLVLLAGDLLDGHSAFRETGEQLAQALGQMQADVFLAPGNHDWYAPDSVWETVAWPENVHLFKSSQMTAIESPRTGAVVCGAAFTGAEQAESLLKGYTAPQDGRIYLGLLHGEIEPSEARYNPLRREEITSSGLRYLALGHIHKRTEPLRFGQTVCAWPGCPEGRGFDELGEKGFYQGTVSDDGTVTLEFVPFARHRYEILQVDVTGQPVRSAVEAALPSGTKQDLYRIVLTGETGAQGAEASAIQTAFADRFNTLEVRDCTRIAEDVWARAEEDTLRGLFLRSLREQLRQTEDETERETIMQAVRFGLAALDNRDLT